jgi:SPP1 family predicted phage head-tail adaptor
MHPDELNKRVMLQRRVEGKDASGSIIQGGAWVNVVTTGDGKVWARVRDMTGRQFVAAGGAQNAVSTEIRIRQRAGVAPKMRVLHAGEIYDIEAALDRDGRWIDLMCTQGLNNG